MIAVTPRQVQRWIDRCLVGCLLMVLLLSAHQSFAQDLVDSLDRRTWKPPSSISRSRFAREQLRQQRSEEFRSRFVGETQFALGARSLEDERFQQTAASMRADTRVLYSLTDQFDFNGEMRIIFNSERSQRAIQDDQLDTGFRLRRAELGYEPFNFMRLSAGALKQGDAVRSILLVEASEVFPGARQQLMIGDPAKQENYILFQSQQSIPTSRSLDTERVEKEPLPYFFLETLAVGYSPKSWVTIEPYFSLWRYRDLPAKVAFEGINRGNTVLDAMPTNSEFLYGFEGYLTGIQADFRLNRDLIISPFFHDLRNNRAPQSFNSGRMLGLEGLWTVAGVTINPMYYAFYNESDSSVSAYNAGELGRNNREGYASKLRLHFNNLRFSLVADYFDARVINQGRQDQTDQTYWTLSVETFHVQF